MKKLKYIALGLSALLLASCAMEEMFDGFGPQEGEEVVMTFKPEFEDFESVTKAIGDASKINTLLVHVYEKDRNDYTLISYEFGVQDRKVTEEINIPFYYGKEYEVYFWAYNSNSAAYIFDDDGLKYGVEVNYPDEALDYDSLEELDAFYSYKKIDLTKDSSKQPIALTRPFAQVNFIADKQQLANALATEVVFELPGSTTFTPGQNPAVGNSEQLTFRFKNSEYFQDNEVFTTIDGMDKVYLGTTYIFVGSATSIEAYVTLLDKAGQVLKKRTKVSITLDANCRTNLTFSGIEPAWDDEAMDIPDPDGDGWIHISKPEELAQLLITGTDSETKVYICDDIDLSGIPAEVKAELGSKSFAKLTIDGGKYENHNMSGSLLGGGSYMIKNMTAPAFFNEATDLTVRNLTFKGMKVWTAASHVGVIVNTLHGSSSFTNVIVENSDVSTTNGAAGGMVGYIVRTSEMDRAESVSVTIDACKVNSTNAGGTLAEGKFVGMLSGYDNGEQLVFTSACSTENASVADWTSPYVEGNEGAWLAGNDYTAYDGWLGNEVYYRGKVYFGGTDDVTNRFCPKWDGTTSVEPLVESNIKLIYSAFDVAKLQKSSHSAVTFKTDVDLGSYRFDPIKSITNLDGENNTIYNLKVDMVHDGTGAAFIQLATGTTTHKDITFIGADIKNVHNPNIPIPNYGNTNDGGAGNAYAGTLVSHSGGTYTVSNVHVKNGKVYAVCKMGGLVGYVGSTTFNMSDCSVDGYMVENYEPGIPNYYTLPRLYELNLSSVASLSGLTIIFGVGKIPNTAVVNCLQWWYTNGECGGLVGFIKSPSAIIDNCSVTNTEINCVGQPNKPVVANVWDKTDYKSDQPYRSGIKIFAKGNTDVAGRHVNQFIGDIVSERKEGGSNYNITISDYVVSGNKYFGVDAVSATQYNHNYASGKYCEVVGCAYYVGVDVKLFGVDLTHVNDCAGSLTFNPLNGETVTVTENVKQGNDMSWVGGSFTDAEYRQKNSGSLFRPSWSYNVDSFYPTYP